MIEDRIHDARILIVDDEPSSVRLLCAILARAGFENVRSTGDSRQALALCNDFRPDLLLLDLHMPHVDGFEVLRQLSTFVQDSVYFPVLVLSADITHEARQLALSSGAKDFVNKPFDTTEVQLRIRNLLATRFLAVALEREKQLLEERVRERTRELEDAQEVIVERLARAADYRDDATGRHAQRVGEMSARIAHRLGLPASEVELIRRAAPLHDIGKIGVPDNVLLKKGPLAFDERRLSEQHPLIGARILSGSDFPLLNMAEQIALSHHERWDGTGYPLGLAGDRIPLAGRIVAVADVFDALTHVRPYKHAWSQESAIEEIRAASGTQFDARVVNAFVEILAGVPTIPVTVPPRLQAVAA